MLFSCKFTVSQQCFNVPVRNIGYAMFWTDQLTILLIKLFVKAYHSFCIFFVKLTILLYFFCKVYHSFCKAFVKLTILFVKLNLHLKLIFCLQGLQRIKLLVLSFDSKDLGKYENDKCCQKWNVSWVVFLYFLPFPTPPFYLRQYRGHKEICKRIPVISEQIDQRLSFINFYLFWLYNTMCATTIWASVRPLFM